MLKRPTNFKRKTQPAGRDRQLLVRASTFFRRPETFTVLRNRVFPEIIKRHAGDQPVRVWVPGCATGEEAYSVAVAFREFAEECGQDIKIEVFATDSNIKAIGYARAGVY